MESLMWVFPIIFMFHEFEEIVFFVPWIKKNKKYLLDKYKWSKNYINRFEGISSESFSIGVFEEFIIVCIFTVVCIQFNLYNLFFSLVLVYFLHLLIHILQCIYIKKYVPGTLSGVISSVHNVYIFYEFYEHQLVNWKCIIPYTLILFIFMIINIHFCLNIGKKVYAVISGKILIK